MIRLARGPGSRRHFHLWAFHRHPDWRGHPNPERWHVHGPFWHDHEGR